MNISDARALNSGLESQISVEKYCSVSMATCHLTFRGSPLQNRIDKHKRELENPIVSTRTPVEAIDANVTPLATTTLELPEDHQRRAT